ASRIGQAAHSPPLSLFLYDLSAAMQLLAPAAVLPVQFYGRPASDVARGEVALMRAVLLDALKCVHSQAGTPSPDEQRLAPEAQQWLFTDDARWPFSFVNICTVLGLDPEYLRRGLRCWQQTPRTRPTARGLPRRAVYRASHTPASPAPRRRTLIAPGH